MLWTPEQQAQARAEKWELVGTVENSTGAFSMRVYGIGVKHHAAQEHVLSNARRGSALHIAALTAIVNSNLKTRKKK